MTGLDLRPLSLGEILDRTFTLYRRHFLLFIGIAALPHLLTLALSLTQVLFLQRPVVIMKNGRPHPLMVPTHGVGPTLVVALLIVILSIFIYLFSQGGTIFAMTELYLGRPTTILASLRRVWDDIGSLFGVIMLNGLVTIVGLILLILPGIYAACRLITCMPAALIEGRGPSESLSRSWDLTRGYAWRSFVILVLYFVLVFGLALLLGLPIELAVATAKGDASILRPIFAANQCISFLGAVLISPVLLISTSIFYFDLRVRKEAFDLQFMMDPTSERVAHAASSVPSILS